jgi:hypothetical protein
MTTPRSHQTVRLGPGSHRVPEDGACVVELASMLGGAAFSDRPPSVCPALREFLHGYNDGLPDALRQDLYALASVIAGSRAPAAVLAWRARLIIDWSRSLAEMDAVTIRFGRWTLPNCGIAGRAVAALAAERHWYHRQTVAFLTWIATRHERRSRSRLEPAALLGEPHRLAPVAGIELLHHRGEVVANGARREVEGSGELGDRHVLTARR